MGSIAGEIKPHAVCMPLPAQGHMNPMLIFSKLLHSHGFHITYVLTEYNYGRLLRTQGPDALKGLPDFRFAAIPDGIPTSDDDDDSSQDIVAVCISVTRNSLAPFRRLLSELNDDGSSPPVSCVVADASMTVTLDAARELGIPAVHFWCTSAAYGLSRHYLPLFIDGGLFPLKDVADFTNGYLETKVEMPGLTKSLRIKDLPTFLRTLDPNDATMEYLMRAREGALKASAIVINTIDEVESPALAELQKLLPPIYTIGPLSLLARRSIPRDGPLSDVSTSLWKEDATCQEWLGGRKLGSVVYVNFGSITVLSKEQLLEFAWGLANSGHEFLWVIRPDLIRGETAVLPPEFLEQTKGRGMMVSWCLQEEVLMHPAVGEFLTHCGWNSMLESFACGVPMVCWPFFADQEMNCRYACTVWGVGVQIDDQVRREKVEEQIREVFEGKKAKEMRRKAVEWRETVKKAGEPRGSSVANLERLIKEVLLRR